MTTKSLAESLWTSQQPVEIVAQRVIDTSTEKLTPRQQSEIGYFLNLVFIHMGGREEFALQYLQDYWCFYSEANPGWLAAAEREVLAYVDHHDNDISESRKHRRRSFLALSDCLQSKTPESSALAFKMLAWDEKKGHMVRI